MKTKFGVGVIGVVLLGVLSAVLIRKCMAMSQSCCAPRGGQAQCGQCGAGGC